ncbi:MAG: hypothetical protein HQ521_12810 [Bacteroidetes bacterium]|nr:hypothetical protein [Bacteroidota bacterium]
MLSSYKIIPNTGFGTFEFGIDMDTFVEKFGEPEEVDTIDEDEELNTMILHYWNKGFSLFFVGLSNPILAGVETDHPDTELYGQKIMGKTEEEIISLMAENGQIDSEEGIEENVGDSHNDRRLSYDESMMDFFFRDEQLVYMNFGVFVDDQGNIEKV